MPVFVAAGLADLEAAEDEHIDYLAAHRRDYVGSAELAVEGRVVEALAVEELECADHE